MKHEHIVKYVSPGSIAQELEIEPGDEIRFGSLHYCYR